MTDTPERKVYTGTIRGTGEDELKYGQERAQRRAVQDGVPEWVVPTTRREYVDADGNRSDHLMVQGGITSVETIVHLRWEWEADRD